MPNKLQSDDDDLMEIFQQHYAELRREHFEYEDAVHKLEWDVAALRGRIGQLEESTSDSPRNAISFWNAITGWSHNSN